MTSFILLTEKDVMPNEKHLEKITKEICAAYLKNCHLRIIPDDFWNERMKQILETVVADLEEDDLEL